MKQNELHYAFNLLSVARSISQFTHYCGLSRLLCYAFTIMAHRLLFHMIFAFYITFDHVQWHMSAKRPVCVVIYLSRRHVKWCTNKKIPLILGWVADDEWNSFIVSKSLEMNNCICPLYECVSLARSVKACHLYSGTVGRIIGDTYKNINHVTLKLIILQYIY